MENSKASIIPGAGPFDFDGNDSALSAILTALVGHELGVISFTEEKSDLEDVFLQVTQGIVS